MDLFRIIKSKIMLQHQTSSANTGKNFLIKRKSRNKIPVENQNYVISILKKENNRLRSASVSLAHDLKNHIQAILLTIESAGKRPTEEIIFNRILKQTHAMKDTVSMIMDYSATYGKESATDPFTILHECSELWKEQVEISTYVVNDHLYRLKIHPGAFRQIMINLIGNSIKYSGMNPVRVTLIIIPSADKVEFRYSDNGPGIPDKIIEKFNDLIPANNPGKNNGSGLWLIRQLLEEAGGSFSFRNKVLCFDIPQTTPTKLK